MLTFEWIFIFIMLSNCVTWEKVPFEQIFHQPTTYTRAREKKTAYTHQIQCHYNLKVLPFSGIHIFFSLICTRWIKVPPNSLRLLPNPNANSSATGWSKHIVYPNISHIKCIRRWVKYKSCFFVTSSKNYICFNLFASNLNTWKHVQRVLLVQEDTEQEKKNLTSFKMKKKNI